jgi:K(+)-stimulated pyrophosphate-energized sodium pump
MSEITLAAGAEVSLSGGNTTVVIIVALIAIVALAMAVLFRQEVLGAPEGTPNMQTIGQSVEEGAQSYLTRQF